MSIDADTLLLGPRGRRACLAVAAGSSGDERLSSTLLGAVMELGGALDPAMGFSRTSVVFSSWNESADDDEQVSAPPITTAEELAAALLAAPIVERLVDPLEVLDRVVGSARYWQEPEGEDFLAALPVFRPALLRAAEVLLSRPDARWWDEPVDPADQWAVDFDPAPDESAPVIAADVRGFRAAAMAEEERARVDLPPDPSANFSGSWWSIPLVWSASFTTTRSLGGNGPAGLRLVEDAMGWELANVRRVGVHPAARVCELRGADDWAELCRRFPLDVTASRRHAWYRTTGRAGAWAIPDWTAVGEEFDGVHLTAAAYLQAAGRAIPVDEDSASVIAGWDPDQTWWFRPDVLRFSEDEAATWRRRNGDWHPGDAPRP